MAQRKHIVIQKADGKRGVWIIGKSWDRSNFALLVHLKLIWRI